MTGMVTGSIATYFVSALSKEEKLTNSVASEQLEYVKSKLNELDSLSHEDVVSINKIIRSVWEETRAKE